MIKFKSISKSFSKGKQSFLALNHIDLQLQSKKITALIGKSGAGKSSLLRLINLLDKPCSGSIEIDGEHIEQLLPKELVSIRKKIGMVFQHYNLLANQTVWENIALPLRISGESIENIRQRLSQLLPLVGLEQLAESYPNQLSGGQKQRVAIARALATKPDILLFDEATAALDPETTQQIQKLIIEIQKELALTIVFVSHETDFVKNLADEIVLLDQGQVIEQQNKIDFFLHPQSDLAKEYVFNNLNQNIGIDYQKTASDNTSHTLLRLTFDKHNAESTTMASLARDHHILFSITAAEIDHVHNTQVGHLVIKIKQTDLETTIQYLDTHQIQHEIIGYA